MLHLSWESIDFSSASEDTSAVDKLADHYYFHPTEQMLQLYACVTFRRGDLKSLYHADIQHHGLHMMIASLFFFPLPLLGSQRDGACCQTAITASLSLSAHGVQLTTHDPQSQTASSSTAREPSASADIFQGSFQQMEVLQVPFGVKYLA